MPNNEVVVLISVDDETNRRMAEGARSQFPDANIFLLYRGSEPASQTECERATLADIHFSRTHKYYLVTPDGVMGQHFVEHTRAILVILRAHPESLEIFRFRDGSFESIALQHQ